MSVLFRGDERLHYSDGSHRWVAPPGLDQAVWEAGVRAHQRAHQNMLGDSPVTPSPRDHPAVVHPRSRKALSRLAGNGGEMVATALDPTARP